jgi:hypothetical protein
MGLVRFVEAGEELKTPDVISTSDCRQDCGEEVLDEAYSFLPPRGPQEAEGARVDVQRDVVAYVDIYEVKLGLIETKLVSL